MYRGSKQIHQFFVFFHIEQTHFDDGFVCQNTECAEYDEKGNWFSHVGQNHYDLFICVFFAGNSAIGFLFRGRHNFDRHCANGFCHVFRNTADFGGNQIICRIFEFMDIEHIVGELFLGNDGFFFALNDEISAHIIATFAHRIKGFARKVVQNAKIGLDHNGKSP